MPHPSLTPGILCQGLEKWAVVSAMSLVQHHAFDSRMVPLTPFSHCSKQVPSQKHPKSSLHPVSHPSLTPLTDTGPDTTLPVQLDAADPAGLALLQHGVHPVPGHGRHGRVDIGPELPHYVVKPAHTLKVRELQHQPVRRLCSTASGVQTAIGCVLKAGMCLCVRAEPVQSGCLLDQVLVSTMSSA